MTIRTVVAQELRKAAIGFTAIIGVTFGAGGLSTGRANGLILQVRPAEWQILLRTEGAPKTESILRKAIQDLQEGKPDFQSMEPALQMAVKQQAEHTADIYRHLGTLQTLKYIGTRDGTDIYRAVYQNAAVTYTIQLSRAGKISALALQPAFPWE